MAIVHSGHIGLKSSGIEARERGSPREWFIAALGAIEMAIRSLVNGEIVHYRYDADVREVVERDWRG